MTWVLLVMIHVGAFGGGNSNAITHVAGFKSLAECEKAGQAARKLTEGTVKETRTVCVEQSRG